jgi:hypothetical protein
MPTVFLRPAGSDSAGSASSGDYLLRPKDGDLYEVGKVGDGCTWVGTLSAACCRRCRRSTARRRPRSR